jgi:hypothetical protein
MGTSIGATPPSAEPRRTWFERNWIWFIPTGCLTIIVLFFAFIAGVLGIVQASFKSSDAYTQALVLAQDNSQVSDKIGKPLKPGWFVSGSINVSGDSGDADISIPISGPKGNGKIYAVAKKVAGVWQYETLQVEVNGQQDRIDILQAPPAKYTGTQQ